MHREDLVKVGEPITPIEFTPPQEQPASRPRLHLNRWHGVIASAALVAAAALFFVLTARSVYVEVEPANARVNIDGGFNIPMGHRFLIRSGEYEVNLRARGYHPETFTVQVSDEQAQTFSYALRKLPGLVNVETPGLSGARVLIDEVDLGETPLQGAPVEPGSHTMQVSLDRYLDYSTDVLIEGRQVEQDYTVQLQPAWAVVGLSSNPAGAEVLVDGRKAGITPANIELLQGRRDIALRLRGHKDWQDNLSIVAGEDFDLPLVQLELADGLLSLLSAPEGASVTVDGEFQGLTPLQVYLSPDQVHLITFFKDGYQSVRREARIATGEQRELEVQLQPVLSSVRIVVQPAGAELYVDGEPRGDANQTIELMAASQRIEIRKEGYVPYSADFTSRPGLEQEIRVTLKSEAQARRERLQLRYASAGGQDMVLLRPDGAFTMGASRRQAGRRPDEVLRTVNLQRLFYLSVREVSNAEYRLFDPGHNSGTSGRATLNNEAQPVVRVSWNDAALYCNWLSAQEGLPPFYQVQGEGEDETVVGFNSESTGYRLPTEAEWAWAARSDGSGGSLKYPWGEDLPPPEGAGNFADSTASSFIADALRGYNDGFFATAPVATFTPNRHGIYDMAGNAAEWVHDFYTLGITTGISAGNEINDDPLGMNNGQDHSIRGSSWKHGSVTHLRLSYRDSGSDPRDDLGFRVARYAE